MWAVRLTPVESLWYHRRYRDSGSPTRTTALRPSPALNESDLRTPGVPIPAIPSVAKEVDLIVRKAVLVAVLTLPFGLGLAPLPSPLPLSDGPPGSAPSAVSPGYAPQATDFIYPVGDPRIAPTTAPDRPNGYRIKEVFNNSCDPALAQGFYNAGQYYCGHTGVDLVNEGGADDAVHATASGLVAEAGYVGAMGEMVRIQHLLPNGSYVYSVYQHMALGSLLVGRGQVVTMGQPLGRVGDTGFAIGAHLHFAIESAATDGVGYTFGDAALLAGFDDPLAYVAAHAGTTSSTPLSPTAASTTPQRGQAVLALASTPWASTTASPTVSVFAAEDTPTKVATTTPADTPTTVATTTPADTPTTVATATAADTPAAETTLSALDTATGADTPTALATTPTVGTTPTPIAATPVGSQHDDPGTVTPFDGRYPSYVTVTDDGVNVRAGSGYRYAPFSVVAQGTRLGYLGVSGDGWVRVALPSNATGYVARQWVEGGPLPTLPPVAFAPVPTRRPPYVTVLDTRYPARNGPLMRDMALEPLWVGETLSYLRRVPTSPSWDEVILPSGRLGYILNWTLRGPWGGRRTEGGGGSPHAALTGKPATAATGSVVVTTVDHLNLRPHPRLDGAPLASLEIGTRLRARGVRGDWIAVTTPGGQAGYVLGRYVRREGSTARRAGVRPRVIVGTSEAPRRLAVRTPPSVTVDVLAANMRAAPSLHAPVLLSLARDTPLILLDRRGEWLHVRTRAGLTAWISRPLTRPA